MRRSNGGAIIAGDSPPQDNPPGDLEGTIHPGAMLFLLFTAIVVSS